MGSDFFWSIYANICQLDTHLSGQLPGYKGNPSLHLIRCTNNAVTFKLRSCQEKWIVKAIKHSIEKPQYHLMTIIDKLSDALRKRDIYIPKLCLYCEDESIIGAHFTIYECLEGRNISDPRLMGLSANERRKIYDSMNETLAAIHTITPNEVGLSSSRAPSKQIQSQITLWQRSCQNAKVDKNTLMEQLASWLRDHIPKENPVMTHGDYRIENLILHPTEPRILAVIDWELADFADPVADFIYHCISWRFSANRKAEQTNILLSLPFAALPGIPREDTYKSAYLNRTGRTTAPAWTYYRVYHLFRLAAYFLSTRYTASEAGRFSAEEVLKIGIGLRSAAAKLADCN